MQLVQVQLPNRHPQTADTVWEWTNSRPLASRSQLLDSRHHRATNNHLRRRSSTNPNLQLTVAHLNCEIRPTIHPQAPREMDILLVVSDLRRLTQPSIPIGPQEALIQHLSKQPAL